MKILPRLPFLPAFVYMAASCMAQDVRVGLVAYWPLDEISVDGLITPDKATSQSDLTLVNMDASSLVPGMRGNAMNFNGTNQLLWTDTGAGTNPGLPLQNNVRKTICLWVKADGRIQGDRRFFAEASMASTNPLFNLSTDSATSNRTAKLDIYVRSDGGTATVNHAKSTGEPLNNDWHHIALTDDNGTVRYFIDGVQDAAALTYIRPVTTLNTLSLGGIQRLNGPVAFFNGTLDDVAVWNRILTPAEIQQVMANGLVTPVPPLVIVDRPGPYRQGDRVQFSVSVPGTAPSTWQWQFNGSPIAGATESTLLLPSLTTAQQGSYSVLIDGSRLSTAVPVAVAADPAPAVTNSIVSWWPFESLNESSTPPVTPDPWGGHPLSTTDLDAADLGPGVFGKALNFDGVTTLAARTTGFPISSNPEYSVAFWVKGDGLTQNDLRIFAEGSNTTTTPLFGMGTANDGSARLRMYVRSDGNQVAVDRNSTSLVLDDTWHHVVWTDRNGQARLYVDGVMDATNFSYDRSALTFTLNQTSVGGIQRLAPSHWFRGSVDDVAVWNRALTWSEVQSLRTSGVPAPVSAVPPDVTVQPIPRTLWEGRAVSLSIQATGTAPFSYQWLKNNSPVPTGTEATLTLDPAVPGDSGTYICRVTNAAGSEDSMPAIITVRPIVNLDSGRLSAWPLDSGNPTSPDTLSGRDLTLTNFGAAEPWAAGIKGSAAKFDGVDDFLVHTWTGTGEDKPVTSREEFSLSFWVRGSALGQSDRRIISEASTINTSPLFNLGTDAVGATDLLNVFIRADAGAVPVNHRTSLAPVLDGFWHHVIYTDYRGAVQLYVDGLPDLNFSYTRPVSTYDNFSVGAIARATPSHWFNGLVDEVNSWDRALSAEDAAALYLAQPKPTPTLAVTSMVSPAEGHLQFSLSTSFGNADYRVESSPTMAAGSWLPENGASISAASMGVVTIDLFTAVSGRRFYRVYIP